MSMTSMSGSNNVVVIGGGAAGMMAAGTAASLGAHVTLLEPNGKLGIAEGGVGIVTDKNYDKLASAETKAAVEAAQNAILNGEVVVDSALTNQELATQLRDAVRP